MNHIDKAVRAAGVLFCVAIFVPVFGTPLLIGSGVVAAGGGAYAAYKSAPELAQAFNRIFKSNENMQQGARDTASHYNPPPAVPPPRTVTVEKRKTFRNPFKSLKNLFHNKSLW